MNMLSMYLIICHPTSSLPRRGGGCCPTTMECGGREGLGHACGAEQEIPG